ncbi:DUF4278 domain-containing protein [Phormidium sp. FACHB-1136]|jgi:hypothetical protein|uniref:DUF4278 domain-containing protein n=1 Tax=Phormidium sp. FACHB-1136 TaxID=2692848 RepID=UPI001689FDEC|nr:DUF4278 domain-containing protein [Phormidium sp. FACHB-1136]MBD2426325.1 DUF4278 domain-containing protein [Phormidium sp. FACHB-1136]
MSLMYRGITYNPTQAAVEMSEEVIGRYRGAVATRHLAKNAKADHAQGLKYRGAWVR